MKCARFRIIKRIHSEAAEAAAAAEEEEAEEEGKEEEEGLCHSQKLSFLYAKECCCAIEESLNIYIYVYVYVYIYP